MIFINQPPVITDHPSLSLPLSLPASESASFITIIYHHHHHRPSHHPHHRRQPPVLVAQHLGFLTWGPKSGWVGIFQMVPPLGVHDGSLFRLYFGYVWKFSISFSLSLSHLNKFQVQIAKFQSTKIPQFWSNFQVFAAENLFISIFIAYAFFAFFGRSKKNLSPGSINIG